MSRPSKLTPETLEKLIRALRAGNDQKVAAELAGIGETTFYRWMELAQEPNAKKDYREFRESVLRALAAAEADAVVRIQQAAQNGRWQAAAWWLERKHAERWGRNDKIRAEISGPNGTPIQIDIEEAKKAILEFINEGSVNGSITQGTDIAVTDSGTTAMAEPTN
jgi:hypothetical protein